MIKNLHKKITGTGRVGALFAFAVVGPGIGIFLLISTHHLWFEPLKSADLQSLIIFLISAIILAGLSIIPTHAVSLIAGMIFGASLGPAYAIIAIIGASILSYFFTDFLVKDKAVDYLSKNPKSQAIYEGLLKYHGFQTFSIITLIRLSPIMPFAATNVLLASAKVSLKEFLTGSTVGLAPRIIIVAIAGAGLSKFDLSKTHHQGLLISGIIATLAAIFILGLIAKKALKRMVNIPD